MKIRTLFSMTVVFALLAGCAASYDTRVDNRAGRPSAYEDVGQVSAVSGIGIESQDIVSMTDRMMRSMLTNPTLVNRPTPPRVVVDSESFRNVGSVRIDKDLITDRLRVELNRAANGRLIFIGRQYTNRVMAERELKSAGVVDQGTLQRVAAPAGVDFFLGGKINAQDIANPSTGERSRYHQITFEMVDTEFGSIVWSDIFEMRKSGQNDLVY